MDPTTSDTDSDLGGPETSPADQTPQDEPLDPEESAGPDVGDLVSDSREQEIVANVDEQIDVLPVDRDDVRFETGETGGIAVSLTDAARREVQRRRATQELADDVPGSLAAEDVQLERTDEGLVGLLTGDRQAEAAADRLDQRVEAISVGRTDVEQTDEGFGLDEQAQRELAAEQLDEQLPGRDIGPADVERTDEGFTVATEAVDTGLTIPVRGPGVEPRRTPEFEAAGGRARTPPREREGASREDALADQIDAETESEVTAADVEVAQQQRISRGERDPSLTTEMTASLSQDAQVEELRAQAEDGELVVGDETIAVDDPETDIRLEGGEIRVEQETTQERFLAPLTAPLSGPASDVVGALATPPALIGSAAIDVVSTATPDAVDDTAGSAVGASQRAAGATVDAFGDAAETTGQAVDADIPSAGLGDPLVGGDEADAAAAQVSDAAQATAQADLPGAGVGDPFVAPDTVASQLSAARDLGQGTVDATAETAIEQSERIGGAIYDSRGRLGSAALLAGTAAAPGLPPVNPATAATAAGAIGGALGVSALVDQSELDPDDVAEQDRSELVVEEGQVEEVIIDGQQSQAEIDPERVQQDRAELDPERVQQDRSELVVNTGAAVGETGGTTIGDVGPEGPTIEDDEVSSPSVSEDDEFVDADREAVVVPGSSATEATDRQSAAEQPSVARPEATARSEGVSDPRIPPGLAPGQLAAALGLGGVGAQALTEGGPVAESAPASASLADAVAGVGAVGAVGALAAPVAAAAAQPTQVRTEVADQFGLEVQFGTEFGLRADRRLGRGPDRADPSDTETADAVGSRAADSAATDQFAPGWLTEQVQAIATRGGAREEPSQDVLADRPDTEQLTGELPTQALVEGGEDAEQIEEVSALLAGEGSGLSFGDNNDRDGGLL